jgi:hypothetical protein
MRPHHSKPSSSKGATNEFTVLLIFSGREAS